MNTQSRSASSNVYQENRLFKRRKLFHPLTDDVDNLRTKLSDQDWRKIRELIRKSRIDLAKQPSDDDYIINLIKKNKIYGDDDNDENLQQKFSKWISSIYYSLNEFPEARSVMQIISTSAELMIVFDVSRHHVACIDPMSTEMTDGVTYGCYDQIIIAAKDLLVEHNERQRLRAMGLVIHEFCHYAIYLTYCNFYQPYLVDDAIRISLFERVRKECELNSLHSEVIEKALHYDENDVVQELLVRYVQALVESSDNDAKISQFKTKFPLLTEFYEKYLMIDFASEYYKMKVMNKIKVDGGLEFNMKNLKMLKQSSENNNKFFEFVKVIKLRTNSTLIAMNEIYHKFERTENFKSIFIFTSLKYVTEKINFELVCEAMTRITKPLLILDCESSSEEKIESCITNFADMKISSNIILVCNSEEIIGDMEMCYTCADLSNEFLNKFTSNIVNFQNKEMVLSDLVSSEELRTFKNMPLNVLEKMMDIGIDELVKRCPYYIERKFMIERNESKRVSANQIIELDFYGKILLLANEPGMGKSVETTEMFFRFKHKYPAHWTVLINLRNHYKTLEKTSNTNHLLSVEEISQFLCHNFLKIEGFHAELFLSLLRKNRVIFMFDSFDEISPKNISFMLNIISKINEVSKCSIWLSTRLHLLEKIKQVLKFDELRLEEFNELSRNNFLTKFLCEKNLDDDDLESKIMKIKRFMAKKEFQHFQNPLMIYIISKVIDTFDDYEDSELTIYKLYETFISELILSSLMRGDSIKREFYKFGVETLDEFLQYYSLKKFVEVNLNYDENFQIEFNKYIDDFFNDLEKPDIQLLQLFNIIYFENSQSFNFIHQNFMDFYVVKFIKNKLTKNPSMMDFKIIFDIFGRSILTRNFKVFLDFLKSSRINFSSFRDFKLLTKIFEPDCVKRNQQKVNIGKLLIFFCRSFEKIVWRDENLSKKFKEQSIYSLLFHGLNEAFDILTTYLDNQQMHQLIMYRDCLGRTVFHNFFTFDDIESIDIYNTTDYEIFVSTESFELFAGKIINFLNKNEMKLLLKTKNRYGRLPFLDAAISNCSFPVEIYLLKLHENLLVQDENENLNYFIFILLLNPKFENMNLIKKFLEKFSKNNSFENMVLEVMRNLNGQNVFHMIAKSLEYFPTIDENFLTSRLDIITSNLENYQVAEMLMKNSNGTPLAISSLSKHPKGFTIFYHSVKSFLSKSEINNLLLDDFENDRSILFNTFWQSNPTLLNFALEIYQSHFGVEFDNLIIVFLKKIMKLKDQFKNNEMSWEMSLKTSNHLDKNAFIKTQIDSILSRLKNESDKVEISKMFC